MAFLVRKSGLIALLIIIGVCAAIVLRGPNGIPALAEKRKEIQLLQEANASLVADNERKRTRIKALTDNPGEQELLIRERFRKLRPGETELIIPDAPKSEPAKPAK